MDAKIQERCYCIVNVNDFRKNGVFYPYHADTMKLFQRAGWVLHDLWVVRGLLSGMPQIFAVDHNLKRRAPKLHEYAIIFRPRKAKKKADIIDWSED